MESTYSSGVNLDFIRSIRTLSGLLMESTRSPSGVHQEYQDLIRTPDGLHQDLWLSVTYSQYVIENDSPFGNTIIILLGDFWQTCPVTVIHQGSHAQIVGASIKSSPLWSDFTIHYLHRHW